MTCLSGASPHYFFDAEFGPHHCGAHHSNTEGHGIVHSIHNA